MDACLRFRYSAIVDLYFSWFAEDEDALDCFAAAGNDHTLGNGVGV